MSRRIRRTGSHEAGAWPGWVDALSSLIMAIIFLLLFFVIAEFYLANTLSGRDQTVQTLNQKLESLSAQLMVEQRSRNALENSLEQRDNELKTIRADRETIELKLRDLARLQADLSALREVRNRLESEIAAANLLVEKQKNNQQIQIQQIETAEREQRRLSDELRLSEEQRRLLMIEFGSLRDLRRSLETQLSNQTERTLLAQREIEQRDIRIRSLQSALDNTQTALSGERNRADQLDQKLAIALARKVEELARYRSEFFGRLRETLGNRSDIRIVGDRFVFQSEVLFPSGSATLEEAGKLRLAQLAQTLASLTPTIPTEINWILRVDGHTDARRIATAQFRSNWELSSARAISVVRFLIEQGIPSERLAAAGFGEFQPLDSGVSEEVFARNRRIEIKFDQK
ncbi:chemotaxis protein MotB [Azospirillaceae bacterium]